MTQSSANSTAVVLNNTAQSIGNLSSVWNVGAQASATTITQTITLNGTTLTINASGNTTFGDLLTPPANVTGTAAITGTGGIFKNGLGTLTLTGTNTYLGSTAIGLGTLKLDGAGSINNSVSINVSAGAVFDVSGVSGGYTLGAAQTLNGNGTITGAVTIAGTVAPGNSVGTITADHSVSFADGSVLNVEVDPTSADLLALTGTGVDGILSLSGIETLMLSGTFAAPNYTIATFDSLSGTFNSIVGLPGTYDIHYNAHSITLDASESVAPEPAGLGALAIGAVAMLGRRRRRTP